MGWGPIELFLVPASAQLLVGARCSSEVRVFAHGAMGLRLDPSWWDPLSYFSF